MKKVKTVCGEKNGAEKLNTAPQRDRIPALLTRFWKFFRRVGLSDNVRRALTKFLQYLLSVSAYLRGCLKTCVLTQPLVFMWHLPLPLTYGDKDLLLIEHIAFFPDFVTPDSGRFGRTETTIDFTFFCSEGSAVANVTFTGERHIAGLRS